jgi:hypothetical protein
MGAAGAAEGEFSGFLEKRKISGALIALAVD